MDCWSVQRNYYSRFQESIVAEGLVGRARLGIAVPQAGEKGTEALWRFAFFDIIGSSPLHYLPWSRRFSSLLRLG